MRLRLSWSVTMFAISAMLGGCVSADVTASTRPVSRSEPVGGGALNPAQALANVNAYRRAHGLASVRLDAAVTSAARAQSLAMARQGRMSHEAGGDFRARLISDQRRPDSGLVLAPTRLAGGRSKFWAVDWAQASTEAARRAAAARFAKRFLANSSRTGVDFRAGCVHSLRGQGLRHRWPCPEWWSKRVAFPHPPQIRTFPASAHQNRPNRLP